MRFISYANRYKSYPARAGRETKIGLYCFSLRYNRFKAQQKNATKR